DDNTRQRERLRHSRACHAGALAVPDVPNQHSCNTGSGVTSRDCFVSQEGTMSARILSFALTFVASIALPAASFAQSALDELAREVDRAESMRAVKNLQRTYAHYAQYGLWNEMGALFAENGQYIFDGEAV